MTALRWLKANNPLYADIDINEEWLGQAMANDDNLFAGMVEPSDANNMNDSDNNDINSDSVLPNNHCGNANQPMDKHSTHSIPSNLPSDTCKDAFTMAFNVIERVARENGFAIRDIPYDGNCLFSSIAYQLEPITECKIDNCTLRQMVADHLENNGNLYKGFLSQPVVSHDAYNADTEPPSVQDAYIETVADLELQTELRWAKYVQRLRDGAWGDHIAIQGTCDMLNVTVNVLNSQNLSMIPILPRSYIKYDSQGEVYIGLIMQHHYVGLPMDVQTSHTCTTTRWPA